MPWLEAARFGGYLAQREVCAIVIASALVSTVLQEVYSVFVRYFLQASIDLPQASVMAVLERVRCTLDLVCSMNGVKRPIQCADYKGLGHVLTGGRRLLIDKIVYATHPCCPSQATNWILEKINANTERRFFKTHANLKDIPCGKAPGVKVL